MADLWSYLQYYYYVSDYASLKAPILEVKVEDPEETYYIVRDQIVNADAGEFAGDIIDKVSYEDYQNSLKELTPVQILTTLTMEAGQEYNYFFNTTTNVTDYVY